MSKVAQLRQQHGELVRMARAAVIARLDNERKGLAQRVEVLQSTEAGIVEGEIALEAFRVTVEYVQTGNNAVYRDQQHLLNWVDHQRLRLPDLHQNVVYAEQRVANLESELASIEEFLAMTDESVAAD